MAALLITYNVRSLLVRWKSTLLAIVGIGLAVAVFVSLLSMASGFRFALRATGSAQNGIVLQQGSQSELSSSFSKEAGDRVAVDSRIARGADGKPLVSPELVTIVALPRVRDGVLSNITVRGVAPAAFNVRTGIKTVEGRQITPGLFEITVGKAIQKRIRGLEVGSRATLMKRDFQIVGVFEADGSAFESEIWGDFDAMKSAFNRPGSENSLTVRLADPTTLAAFDRELQADPRFQLEMKPERQYYEDQAGPLIKFLQGLAIFVSVVMGIGAMFGAMNTMYAIVASRIREIGTLRALGFSGLSILLAFVFEGVLLSIIGGIAGCLLSFAIDGLHATTTTSIAEVAFAFRVTAANLAYGFGFAVIMGILGSLLPAFRAAALPIVVALREA
jgi:putative ABC transport system permease protein